MTDIDGLLQMCLAAPADAARRDILCDALAEANEGELEAALRSPHGEAVIRRVYQLADSLKRGACLRLLWCVAVCDQPLTMVSPLSAEDVERISREMWNATLTSGRITGLPSSIESWFGTTTGEFDRVTLATDTGTK